MFNDLFSDSGLRFNMIYQKIKIVFTKFKKPIIIVISSIIILVVVAIVFVSPITKYLIEKNDVKYTGRQIKMDWVYVNPFTGYVHISNLKIYEFKSDSVFISMKSLSGNISIMHLFSKALKISNLTFDQPQVIIIQSKSKFNFDDFAITFSSKGKPGPNAKPLHFYFQNIKIKDGHFYYRDIETPINYSIKNVNIESKDGWKWDDNVISANVSFLSGNGTGGMKGSYSMNLKTLNYILNVDVNKFDLRVFEQYLKAYANYGTFRANLDANLKTFGCFKDAENINIHGHLAINDFHFGKTRSEDYLSFNKLVFNVTDVNPMKHRYVFDSMALIHPYYKYENYDYLDNIETMFGKNGDKISAAWVDTDRFNLIRKIAHYIKILAANFFQSDYKINKFAIYKGDVIYNDFSLNEKFSLEFNSLYVLADSVNNDLKHVNFTLKSGVKPYGNISVNLSINPKDSSDFDMQYHIQKLPATLFNPYMIKYTSFPLDRGIIELNGAWKVRNGIISSNNHLLLVDPRMNARVKNKNFSWLPMRLVMFFTRENGNVIDYEIPITGNLKNPKFHLKDVLFHILGNIFVKPATTPYRMEVKSMENEIEKTLTLKWKMRQSSLLPDQERFLKKITNFMNNSPEASISVYPMIYAEKEKEYILFFEAKKKYFLLSQGIKNKVLSKDDSLKIDKMSIKDSMFIKYLNKRASKALMFTVQDKCYNFVGLSYINAKFKKLNQERKDSFLSGFKDKEVENRVKIYKSENTIPFNGFSFYRIEYKGDYPKALTRAYKKMNALNNKDPRKEFKVERQKNKNAL
jgi:hypothetical protein